MSKYIKHSKDRYCVSYRLLDAHWEEVTAKTKKKEALELYGMIGNEADFKVLYYIVSRVEIIQENTIVVKYNL